jgi:hypothetical protein
LIEVNKGISPDMLLELCTGDDLARAHRQDGQNPKWLLLQTDWGAVLPQLHGVVVEFVHSEADFARHPINLCSYCTLKPFRAAPDHGHIEWPNGGGVNQLVLQRAGTDGAITANR